MSANVRLLDEFRSRGLLNKWFGGLRLLAVEYPRKGDKSIRNAVCRVVCEKGHESKKVWWLLRDKNRKRVCPVCKPVAYRVTSYNNSDLRKKIDELSPLRRHLFNVLLESRRRAPGQDDTRDRELLVDTLAYARDVGDPGEELRELGEEGRLYSPGASSSLSSPSFIYAGVE